MHAGQLLLGGGAVMQDYFGMNKILASFLIPFGVVGYTIFANTSYTAYLLMHHVIRSFN